MNQENDAAKLGAGMMIFISILIIAVIVLNIVGTVAAVKYSKRKEVSQDSKIAAGAMAAGSWIVFPFLSIGPIVMEGNAKKAAKKAAAAKRLRLR